jgi:hypothetical protein
VAPVDAMCLLGVMVRVALSARRGSGAVPVDGI